MPAITRSKRSNRESSIANKENQKLFGIHESDNDVIHYTEDTYTGAFIFSRKRKRNAVKTKRKQKSAALICDDLREKLFSEKGTRFDRLSVSTANCKDCIERGAIENKTHSPDDDMIESENDTDATPDFKLVLPTSESEACSSPGHDVEDFAQECVDDAAVFDRSVSKS